MILGVSLSTFTVVHTVLSLIGIAAGLVVLIAMFSARRVPGWTVVFLATTVLTSITGFLFPSNGFTPAQAFGAVSLVVLAAAIVGLYVFHLAGAWRWVYTITAMIALYLNCFVLIVQAFQKLPILNALAPTQTEPPFQIVQGVVLIAFIVLGILAVLRFHPERRQEA
jgi:hypothetical protein